jgi:outer membrane protein FlgP
LPRIRPTAALALAMLAGACMPTHRSAMQSLPPRANAETVQLAEVKDALDTLSPQARVVAVKEQAPMITGMGFAQIAGQPGKTANEKRLMAIRAARVDALRDLTEQVHGIRLNATTTVRDAVVRDDHVQAVVAGTLRGAKTLSISPRDSDSYEVKMAIDRDTVAYILRAVQGGL